MPQRRNHILAGIDGQKYVDVDGAAGTQRVANADSYLKPGMTFAKLDVILYQISDNEAADRLQQARRQLFKTIHEQEWKRA